MRPCRNSPFPGVDARVSRYSYLVSLFPPALRAQLGISVELRRRRVAAYPPVDDVPAWSSLVARVAERGFPTLIEPLRSRGEIGGCIDDERRLGGAVRAAAVGNCSSGPFATDLARGTS